MKDPSKLGLFVAFLLLAACDSADDHGVEVVRYDGPPITHEDANRHSTWVATVDTVFRQVELELIEPENGRVRHRLRFQEDPGALPVLVGYRCDPDSAWSATFLSGTVYIQHFALEGEISGRFEGALNWPMMGLRTGGPFWVDASEPGAITPSPSAELSAFEAW